MLQAEPTDARRSCASLDTFAEDAEHVIRRYGGPRVDRRSNPFRRTRWPKAKNWRLLPRGTTIRSRASRGRHSTSKGLGRD